MLKISTRIDRESSELQTRRVECPTCGKKLVDVQYVSGIAMLCIKCPRCKHLIKINITD